MPEKITGNQDGENGASEHYDIDGRKNVPRKTAVKEVQDGKHPGYHIYKINDEYYIRSNPDNSKRNNVNK